MSNVIGLDMGAVFVKGVLLGENGSIFRRMEKSGRNYRDTALRVKSKLLTDAQLEDAPVFATGCGERCIPFPAEHVGEMNCLVRAVGEVATGPCLILDLGGQSTRLCVMDQAGRLEAFDSSAKCASGSGRVLESAARVLQLTFDDLSEVAKQASARTPFTISCAVFAESEAITAVAQGKSKETIVAGFHDSLCQKFAAMLNKHDRRLPVVATGGMAKDAALIEMLREKSGRDVICTPYPQFCIAFGAALSAGCNRNFIEGKGDFS